MVWLKMKLICPGLNGKLHFPLPRTQISLNGEIISLTALLLLSTSLYISSVYSLVLELPPQFSILTLKQPGFWWTA